MIFGIWRRTACLKQMDKFNQKIVDDIRKNGWRQGAIFPVAAMSAPEFMQIHRPEDDALYITISQSCDILHWSLENEPVVEVLRAYPVESGQSDLEKGRHPRSYRLLVHKKSDESQHWYETNIRERYSISRRVCARYSSDQDMCITTAEISNLARWLASRYTRPALPDAFNARINKGRTKIRKILQKHSEQDKTIPSDFLSNLFLNVTDKELPEHEFYEVSLLGTMKLSDYENQEIRDKTNEVVRSIAAEMALCHNIIANDLCRSEQQVSLHMLRDYRKYSIFDDLTYETGVDRQSTNDAHADV